MAIALSPNQKLQLKALVQTRKPDLLHKKHDFHKHVFLILGDPRTGKTTLGDFATIHERAIHLDTDSLDENNLFDEITRTLRDFKQNSSHNLLGISVGKHRAQNEQIKLLVAEFADDDLIVSICEVSRLDNN